MLKEKLVKGIHYKWTTILLSQLLGNLEHHLAASGLADL